jgi:hypothetical protein
VHGLLAERFEIHEVVDVQGRREQRVDLLVGRLELGVALVDGRLHGGVFGVLRLLLEALAVSR